MKLAVATFTAALLAATAALAIEDAGKTQSSDPRATAPSAGQVAPNDLPPVSEVPAANPKVSTDAMPHADPAAPEAGKTSSSDPKSDY
jgi:hypothetical protein